MKFDDVFANSADRLQERLVTGRMSRGEFLSGDTHRFPRDDFVIEFLCVLKNGRQASFTHIGTDPRDHLPGSQGFTK